MPDNTYSSSIFKFWRIFHVSFYSCGLFVYVCRRHKLKEVVVGLLYILSAIPGILDLVCLP